MKSDYLPLCVDMFVLINRGSIQQKEKNFILTETTHN